MAIYVPALAVYGTDLFAGNVIGDPQYGGVSLTTDNGATWTSIGPGFDAIIFLSC